MKNSQIILCKNIKMDKNYNNVLNYSEADLLAICEANKLEKATNYSFVKPNGNTIDVSFSYENCYLFKQQGKQCSERCTRFFWNRDPYPGV